MTRLEYIRTMTADEIAEKIRDIINLNLDGYCKSDCEGSEIMENEPDEAECVKCCVRWLNEERDR